MRTNNINKKILLDMWDFDWPIMDVLIGGRSSIDLPNLYVDDQKDASNFLSNYGYNPDKNKADARLIHGVIIESLFFIEKFLMPKEWNKGNMPPEEILLCKDVRKLLLWASSNDNKSRKSWSCAILRIMHTIAHIGSNQNGDIEIARTQILARFEKKIFRDAAGDLWLGNKENAVALERVEWKNNKSRDSIILKLLHKPGNVSETIYDNLGIRIITKYKTDVMVVVKFLREFFLVTFPNTHPARARNTLINIPEFKTHIESLREKLEKDEISTSEFFDCLDKDIDSVIKGSSNPHSSNSYRSIQLTCRQLIRYPSNDSKWINKIEGFLESCVTNKKAPKKEYCDLLAEFVDFFTDWNQKDEISDFFPFEVQILDAKMAAAIERGEASHDKYKKSQIRTARRRVLSEVLQNKY